jgi:hypothetical protein
MYCVSYCSTNVVHNVLPSSLAMNTGIKGSDKGGLHIEIENEIEIYWKEIKLY